MALVKITTYTDSFLIELNDASADRAEAEIEKAKIRSIVKSKDDKCIELVFDAGEIQKMSYDVVDEIDGDTDITTQQILWDKMRTWKFGAH